MMTGENAEVMEVEAILLGTRLTIGKDWEQVEIELDSEVVIN